MEQGVFNSYRPLAYAHANRARFVAELKEFVRFPSVSARPANAGDMTRCAEWLADHLRGIGMQRVEVVPTPRHPLVYAEWLELPGVPTVLIYGHYDVQPAEPLDRWRSPPFDPVVRGTDLYGRGASDDKGQMLAHIKALESCLRTSGRLPVNVKCLFEGEEEIGSPNFALFLANNKRALSADVVLVSDTSMLGPDRPAITYGMRGALSLELEVKGPETDLHDGLFGGIVHNPLKGLCDIIAGLHNSGGRIAIPGFYDRVRSVSREERAYMANNGSTDEQLQKNLRTPGVWGESGYTMYERTTIRPSLTITGLSGGYQGAGPKSIIPACAMAKLNFRLVPDQDPSEIEHLVRKHIARLTPFTLRARTMTHFAAKPVVVDRHHPLLGTAAAACQKGFGSMPVFLRSGGTNAAVGAFQNVLELPTAMVGFGLPDDRIHAANEKFHLPNFQKGINTSIWFLQGVGSAVRNANSQRKHVMNTTGPVISHDY